MSGYVTALVLTVVTVGSIVYLLRARRIREKYAAIWIALAIVVLVIGAFPAVLEWLAAALGVIQPVNLLFLVTGLVLFLVCVQFSVEISQLEEETRTLAEEIALLSAKVDAQAAATQAVAAQAAATTRAALDHPTDGSVAPASATPVDVDDPRPTAPGPTERA
ncbi:DUF2304 domain-containing protein [Cellulomonas algicola]|uniref:DUF2304 domain-containing protein n=1 Tax=Cellulomonas algicola TaxID=2071633 RepID=A0A401V4U4_9CELL|nr:DUF2304 domain-containing protein [Cellulomonas algicola]GCD21950.1 hypothetical protein CTKZ_35120 [Cellulomonas algicola]